MALEKILIVGVAEIIKKLIPVIDEHISPLAWGDKNDLRKLKLTLETIHAAVSDAEKNQVNDEVYRLWLRRLKDVVYDADDVMNEYSMMLNSRSSATISSSSGNASQQGKPSIVSIVGMGGLGNTTLAQLIYKDSNLRNFDLKAWVCVSDNFHISSILIKIIECTGDGSTYGGSTDLEPLGNQISKKLKGKNFLLVLEDLWNEDAVYWDNLIKYLNGANRVTILITTRNFSVADVVGGKIQKLADEVCWSIMKNMVSSRDEDVLIPESMTTIGNEIAKRCDGLPLAAKFLGSVMASNTSESYWRSKIRDNTNLWNTTGYKRLVSIIKFSYDKLPSPLKQCFSYCSLFPKDWKFERDMLVRLWMAEGFLQPSDVYDHRSIEDIGNDSFELLLSNSFFQDTEKNQLGVIVRCKMHDIVHDFALSVVDVEEYGILQSSALKIRRLQLVFGEGSSITVPEALSEAKKLRTVVAHAPKNCSQINSFFSNKRLRVLCPLGDWGNKICTSIPKLKHLRYLDLSGCQIDLMHPVSLNHSYNLQTLVLRKCVNVSELLRKSKSLKSLRHLDLTGSDIKLIPDSIVHLTNLQTLNLFYCSKFEALPENIRLLRDMRFLDLSHTAITKLPDSIIGLTNLQTLSLRSCSRFEALPENIESLIHLSFLDLSSTAITKLPDSVTLLSNLRILEFSGCHNLEVLPRDFGDLTQLRHLDVGGTKIKELPESCTRRRWNLEVFKTGDKCKLPRDIQNWPNLKHFTHYRRGDIMPRGMEKLVYLETLDSYMVRKEADQICSGTSANDYRTSSHRSGIEELAALNSLKVLRIFNLQNLRGGIEDAQKAKLKDKTNLSVLGLHWWRSNRVNENQDMVLEGLRPQPNLSSLNIHGFSGLNLPKWMGSSANCLLPNLVSLRFSDCRSCKQLPAIGMLPRLRNLTITGLKSVKCLVTEFSYKPQKEEKKGDITQTSTTTKLSLFPSLVRLEIWNMENLEEWVAPSLSSFYVDSFPLLDYLNMRDCGKLRSPPNSFPSLERLELTKTNSKAVYSILSASRRGRCFTSLTNIVIRDSPKLIYFPLSVLEQNNAPNLRYLRIENCSEFQGFRDDDLYNNNSSNNISSLHKLVLERCPVLTFLPDLRLWNALRELTIFKCDKLKKSIPSDYKKSLSFLDSLKVDFIQKADYRLRFPYGYFGADLINLMET